MRVFCQNNSRIYKITFAVIITATDNYFGIFVVFCIGNISRDFVERTFADNCRHKIGHINGVPHFDTFYLFFKFCKNGFPLTFGNISTRRCRTFLSLVFKSPASQRSSHNFRIGILIHPYKIFTACFAYYTRICFILGDIFTYFFP